MEQERWRDRGAMPNQYRPTTRDMARGNTAAKTSSPKKKSAWVGSSLPEKHSAVFTFSLKFITEVNVDITMVSNDGQGTLRDKRKQIG